MQYVLYRNKHERQFDHYCNAWITNRINRLAQRYQATRQHKMAVFANDLIGISVNVHGIYEKEDLDNLFAFLAPLKHAFKPGLALDIGANIGNHTLYFSRHFARVEAFEPNPDTFHLLSFNTRQTGNACAHNFGLGDAAGSFDLVEDPLNVGGSSISASMKGRSVRVHIAKLDELDMDMTGLSFVKIDVEGFEASVIRGADKTFRAHQPVIAFEQHAGEFKNGQSEVVELLRGMDYAFCWREEGTQQRNVLSRRMANVLEFFKGRESRIVHGTDVPPRHHAMLIAVPPRFQQALGIQRTPA